MYLGRKHGIIASMTYQFSIVIEQDEDGFFAYCPQLQGCYTQGDSYEEALANLEDAIKLHIEDRAANDEEIIPSKSISVATMELAL